MIILFYKIIKSATNHIEECKSFIHVPKPISCDIPIDDVDKELFDVVASKSRVQNAYNTHRGLE